MGQFALVNEAALKVAPGTRVLKAGDYSRMVLAERVLEEARRQAAGILKAAEKRAAEVREAGYADGMRLAKETSSRYMLGIVHKSREYLSENEDKVIALVIAVLRKIIGQMDGQEVVVRMVRTAMAVVSRQSQVTVMVAPDKVEAVKARLRDILQPYPRVTEVVVAGDPKLTGEHCVLETRVGRVEASLESQLQSITGALADVGPGRKERLEQDLKSIELELSAHLNAGKGA